jgi:hypothetical protein
METEDQGIPRQDSSSTSSIRSLIREVIGEFVRSEDARSEPAHKAELLVERQKREQLERRLNELVEENRRSKALAEEAERMATVKSELQRAGVGKVELAFRVIKDDVVRASDGRLVARTEEGDVGLRDFVERFAAENPEFLPARISGGSGLTSVNKASVPQGGGIDLEKIKPGMSPEELEKVRQEISRIATQTLKGL